MHNVQNANSTASGVEDGDAVVGAPLHAQPGHHEPRVRVTVWVRHVAVSVTHEELEHASAIKRIALRMIEKTCDSSIVS